MNKLEYSENDCIQIFKAIGDETRFEIIRMLRDGELCACKILDHFNFSQPTLSYHMKILTKCGLVEARKEGLWMQYSLNAESFEAVRYLLQSFCASKSQKSVCS